MLDYFCIFTRGGFVLWTFQLSALKGSPIDALIQTCLLQERSGERSFQYSKDSSAYTLKWTFHNDLGLVFVAVYQRMLQLLYVDELLEAVKTEFSGLYSPKRMEYLEFGDTFRQLMREAEDRAKELKRPKQVTNFQDTKKGKQLQKGGPNGALSGVKKGSAASSGKGGRGSKGTMNGEAQEDESGEDDDSREDHADSALEKSIPPGSAKSASSAFDVSKLRKRTASAKAHSKSANPFFNGGSNGKGPNEQGAEEGGKKKGTTRAMRKWEEGDSSEMKDFSKKPEEGELQADVLDVARAEKSLMDAADEDNEGEEEEVEEEDHDDEDVPSADGTLANGKAPAAKASGSWLSSIFQSVAGKPTLDAADLEPSLRVLKQRLMSKNVAEEIAEKLCRSVESSLVGRKQGSFTRIATVVRAAMEEALSRILTPKRSVDILRDVETAKEQGRPYVIVFVGVNGVGKSTNLAKVAYWLTQHDTKVLLAACDTFRAGAVEQLRTHARRLQIPVFEKGYEKDPAAVAKEAIKEAQRTGMDAVLVDTAGRMQDNEPLMRALSKLINLNEPDLVLFVGEALVGNDAVDQLSKFNQRLADLSTSPEPRAIDGILLTKFDTIDDKVGAALSMVYISGAPIVFVGCGQTYTDLRRLNPKQIIRTLLQ